MGFGFHAPELEVLILARTGVATIPIAIKDFWIQGVCVECFVCYPHASPILSCRPSSSTSSPLLHP